VQINRLAARVFDGLNRSATRLAVDIDNRNPRSQARHFQSGGASNAAGGAGNESDFVGKFHGVTSSQLAKGNGASHVCCPLPSMRAASGKRDASPPSAPLIFERLSL